MMRILNSAASDENGITTGAGSIELILDASGSMLKKLDGKTRISVAGQAVTCLVNNSLEEEGAFCDVSIRASGS